MEGVGRLNKANLEFEFGIRYGNISSGAITHKKGFWGLWVVGLSIGDLSLPYNQHWGPVELECQQLYFTGEAKYFII